ncbi:MAG: rhomboid family intramembrane serine protease [Candidatus Eisenbacteria bacterium]|uniref:Rhomboid family intramembrane serine protease n=1 Tax=Eiseniibacteriota bacterium TaxID=2212470 RepID=A0A956LXB7_UNCEI|nr:rhomboid family intramembrane serine protease [Candidatus Eisenbacteria bacterium]
MIPIRDANPSRTRPVVVLGLIAVNAIVFLWEILLPAQGLQELFQGYGVVPVHLTHPSGGGWAWPTLLTYMFLHGGWLHVIGNLWVLWIFGDNIEDRMGHVRFLVFYLVTGVLAALTQSWLTPRSSVPSVGASGAIAGVMGAYIVLFPRARILTIVPVFFYPLFLELPAVAFLGLWFLLQLFSGTLALHASGEVGGIAFWAHVGGFLAGIVLHRLFLTRPRWRRG